MGIFGEIMKGVRHSIEVNKAFLREAPIESIPIVGPALLCGNSAREAEQYGWEEIKVEGLFGTSVGRCRAVEIGTLRNDLGLDIKGYSVEGFYVERGKKAGAVAHLRATGLNVW